MGSVRTFYEMLTLTQGATFAEVDKAYATLLQESIGDTEFHLIDAAYEELSEEANRRLYDAVLAEGSTFVKIYHEYIWTRDSSNENCQLKISLLSQLIGSMKEDIYPLYAELGYAYTECGDYDNALINFDLFLDKEREDSAVLTEKALVLCKMRRFDDAEAAIRVVIDSDPNYIPALEDFSCMLREQGAVDAANDFLEREIISKVEREEETLAALLKVRVANCFEDGEKEKGHELFGEFMTILKNMGSLLHSSYLYENLLTTLKEVGEKRLYQQLADILEFSDLPEEDMECELRKHFEADPHSVDTLLPLVEYLRIHDRKEEAQVLLSDAIQSTETASDKHLLHLNLQRAMFHLEDGERVIAYEILEKALLDAESQAQVAGREEVLTMILDVIEDLQQFGEHHWVQKFANLRDELSKDENSVIKVETREGCFIATAVYGSYDHPQVLQLRRFRDDCLKQSHWGRGFIRVYYYFSPALARKLHYNSLFARMIRRFLNHCIVFFRGN